MHQVAGQIPPWAVYLLLMLVITLASFVFKIVFNRFTRLEGRVDGIDAKAEQHITEDRHQRDLENIAGRHERALEKIAEKHDKELNNVHTRIDDSFERLESRIAESNKAVHGRLDDLHAVLLNILSKNLNEHK